MMENTFDKYADSFDKIYVSKAAKATFYKVLCNISLNDNDDQQKLVKPFANNNVVAVFCSTIGVLKSTRSERESIEINRATGKKGGEFSFIKQMRTIDKNCILEVAVRAKHQKDFTNNPDEKVSEWISRYCAFGIEWLVEYYKDHEDNFSLKDLYDELDK